MIKTIRRLKAPFRPQLDALILACALTLLVASTSHGDNPQQAGEGDEQPSTNWQLEAADCQYIVLLHDQRAEKGDRPSEQITLRSGAGTFVHAARDVPDGLVIDDLQVGTWLRSDRRGLQLFGRIVFPHTIDPKTGQPATLLIAGDTYERVQQWQRVTVSDVRSRLQGPLRVLRARIGGVVDERGAYVSELVINVYGGPGTTNLWLGQIEQFGRVSPSEIATQPEHVEAVESSPVPRRVGNRLLIGQLPFFPRVIEHQGEPLRLIKQLGFNTVYMDQFPSEQQMHAAREWKLWIVCPPPTNLKALSNNARPLAFDRILGWFVGDSFDYDQRPDYLDRLSRADNDKRPIIAGVESDQWRSSRKLDILLRSRPLLGSSFPLSHYHSWLEQSKRLVRPGTPFWSGVQTQLPSAVIQQASLVARDLAPLGTHVQSEQIRQLALSGVAAGARGLWFHSTARLDDPADENRLRRTMLELINHELSLLKPWGMGGQQLGEVRGVNSQLRVLGLATERSRLLIPTYIQPNAQFVCRPNEVANRLVVPGVPDSIDVFALNHVGLIPLKHKRISGGVQIDLHPDHSESLILLTEDPLVVTHINREVNRNRARVVQLEQELSQRLMDEFDVQSSRHLLDDPSRIQHWDTARQALAKSRALAETKDFSAAYNFSRNARRELNKIQADIWGAFLADRSHPLQSPFFASFSLATMAPPLMTDPDSAVDWSQDRLIGGNCEDLDKMVSAGWRQHQVGPSDIETALALSPTDAHNGSHCLRIAARGTTEDARESIIEYPPVWVNTAPINVRPGQRYRLSGWIRIDQTIQGNLDGCSISDNITGQQLALRRRKTNGWEFFQMIRCAERHDHLAVTITLHGLGEVKVDDLKVEVERSEPMADVRSPSGTNSPRPRLSADRRSNTRAVRSRSR